MSFLHTVETHTLRYLDWMPGLLFTGLPLGSPRNPITMKQNENSMELDFFRFYLLDHLREHWFPQYTNEKFINDRADAAYDTLIRLKLEGRTNTYAHEMAMRTLLDGLYVSRYDIIYNMVEENLWNNLPPEYWPDFSLHLLTLPEIHDLLDRYDVNGDFLNRDTHQPMLDELLGMITEILDGYEF